jgi:RNA polymerase sigma-70 factor (ECF subfamily)
MAAVDRQAALQRALQGDQQALGDLLDSFRGYVNVIARTLGSERLQGRVGSSDMIQDALTEAFRSFPSFRGTTVEELTAWLRQIALRTARRTLRDHVGAGKRALDREQAMAKLSGLLIASEPSPSGKAAEKEQSDRLGQALASLPEDMLEVVLGRHLDELAHAEIAQRMNRSEAAVRVLYVRAVRRLRELCED